MVPWVLLDGVIGLKVFYPATFPWLRLWNNKEYFSEETKRNLYLNPCKSCYCYQQTNEQPQNKCLFCIQSKESAFKNHNHTQVQMK